MAFRDLIRKQRQAGAGILPAVGSAAGASIREAVDIRNMLFSKGSILGALFPNIKGFKADAKAPRTRTSPTSLIPTGGSSSALSDAKLDIISQNTKISAKNSLVMPAMARDMNVMRQNIVKLVKLSGGKPSARADMFFMKAGERERAYEAQMQETKAPSKVDSAEESTDRDKRSSGGFLGALGSIFAGAGRGSLSRIFAPLLLGLIPLVAKIILVTGVVTLLYVAIKEFVDWFRNSWIGEKLGFSRKEDPPKEQDNEQNISSIKEEIQKLNPNIVDPNNLTPGQEIRLPNNTSTLVDSEDTFDSIARRYAQGDFNEGIAVTGLGTSRVVGLVEDARTDNVPSNESVDSSTSPSRVSATGDQTTFNQLSREQQDNLLDMQFKREGNKPGNLAFDLNNPGAMLWSPAAAKFGAVIDPNRGSGDLKGKFARFPTFELGREAQRDLWSRKYGNLPLDQAINKWTTGKLKGDGSVEISNYKSAILDALESGSATASIQSTSPVESTTRVPGNQISSASTEVDFARRDSMMTPSVIPVTTSGAAPRTPSTQAQQVSIPSTIDTDLFDALVMRVTEYS
jgi:hypothetical protein